MQFLDRRRDCHKMEGGEGEGPQVGAAFPSGIVAEDSLGLQEHVTRA